MTDRDRFNKGLPTIFDRHFIVSTEGKKNLCKCGVVIEAVNKDMMDWLFALHLFNEGWQAARAQAAEYLLNQRDKWQERGIHEAGIACEAVADYLKSLQPDHGEGLAQRDARVRLNEAQWWHTCVAMVDEGRVLLEETRERRRQLESALRAAEGEEK